MLKNIKKDTLLKACKSLKIDCKSSDKKLSLYKKIREKTQKILSTKKISVAKQKGGMKIDIKTCENSDFTFKNQLNVGDDEVGIYVACDKNNSCGYIAKIKFLKDNYERDVSFFKMLENENITPKLFGNWTCQDGSNYYSTVILEKMDGDLFDLIKLEKPTTEIIVEWLNIIYKKLKKLEKYNSLHIDLKTKNILYKKKNGKYDFFLTDFEWATEFNEKGRITIHAGTKFYSIWTFPNRFYKNFDIVCLMLSVVLHSEMVGVKYNFNEILNNMDNSKEIKKSIDEFKDNITIYGMIIMGYEYQFVSDLSLLTKEIVEDKHILDWFLERYDPRKDFSDSVLINQEELFFYAFDNAINEQRKEDILMALIKLIKNNPIFFINNASYVKKIKSCIDSMENNTFVLLDEFKYMLKEITKIKNKLI